MFSLQNAVPAANMTMVMPRTKYFIVMSPFQNNFVENIIPALLMSTMM
jgi:hypothetical protein